MELTVYQCGLEKCAPLQMKRSEPGNHYLFYYILSGRGVLRVEEEPGSILDYALSAGSGFLIEPGKENCYRTFPEGIWDTCVGPYVHPSHVHACEAGTQRGIMPDPALSRRKLGGAFS